MAKATPSDAAPEQDLDGRAITPKGHATPTRREREAARKKPLVGSNTPEARKISRAALTAQRDRARIGMQNGEEKYLPARDRGPQKRFVRDYVDARYSFGELAIPVFFVVIVVGLVFGGNGKSALDGAINIAFLGFVVIFFIDIFIVSRQLRKRLAAKFGADRVERFTLYAAMRSFQFRRIRLPKPQVKRGEFPK